MIQEGELPMNDTKRILLFTLVLSLSACSGNTSVEVGSPVSDTTRTGEEQIAFPPTWTPTMPPPPPTTTPTSAEISTSGLLTGQAILTKATPYFSASQIVGWQRVEGATATFLLPTTFEVLDMGSEFGMLMAAMMTGMMEGMVGLANDLGESFGADPITPTPLDMSELEDAFNIDFVLATQADHKTSAFLFSEPLEEPSTLEEQVEATLVEQDNPVEIVSAHRLVGTTYETARLQLKATDQETGERGQVLIYVILLEDRVYQLGYTAEDALFNALLPTFEASAASFQLKD